MAFNTVILSSLQGKVNSVCIFHELIQGSGELFPLGRGSISPSILSQIILIGPLGVSNITPLLKGLFSLNLIHPLKRAPSNASDILQ